ncbi:sugar ABC transporter ATP-binding protein [Sinorhizobium sp. BG8]|uniref:sugar ABC transporter ATP-binding protein n=1 Tax=Sinorhizobium sp. BG8 TaxID=2613773 RepID=UPI00193CAB46|nr:sugar ABC transporter ATP-binding protein [Sinorhizobium sp. BG8]QRM57768.1 sugar ABC transporter ATP-binding protein [Sinorhizobium sp. BG8]
MTPLLVASNIAKSFGGAKALSDANFELAYGEVHALFGSNGAGKSTLSRIICGHVRSDSGSLELAGTPVNFKEPREALGAGIAIVTQETNMAPDLSAFENVLLPLYGHAAPIDRKAIRAATVETLERLGLADAIPLDEPVRYLTAARRQMLEIARALTLKSRIIIFDEPTTALSPSEVGRLFEAIDHLRREGKGIVFVSHRLEELFTITDRITVLRDGKTVALARKTAELNQAELIRLMVGRDVAPIGPVDGERNFDGTPVVLQVEHIGDGAAVRDVSFSLRKGEILGLGGLVGAGRSETLEGIFGSRRISEGEIRLRGEPFRASAPIDAIRAGIGYVAEDRRRQSIVPDFSVMENLTLVDMARRRGWRLGRRNLVSEIGRLADRLDMPRTRLEDANLLNFSGGMQQKILMMRCLLLKPDILLLDEPTKGVDIAARSEIYQLLRSVAEEGVSILLVSSDFEELLALSDNIVPISDGRTLGTIPTRLLNEETLTLFAAPRSSTAGQAKVLNALSQRFGCAGFWILRGEENFICLLTSNGAERALGFASGSIVANNANPVAASLASPVEGMQPGTNGQTVMHFRLSNPHDHDLGTAGFLFEPGISPPDPAEMKDALATLLLQNFSHQIRIAT